jgi:hypothetical protein
MRKNTSPGPRNTSPDPEKNIQYKFVKRLWLVEALHLISPLKLGSFYNL